MGIPNVAESATSARASVRMASACKLYSSRALDSALLDTRMLKAEGYGEWMSIDAVSNLPKLFRDAKQILSVDLAQKLDAVMSIIIFPDAMTVLRLPSVRPIAKCAKPDMLPILVGSMV